MDPDAFWRQTPRLYQIIVTAKGRVAERERIRDAWIVWHQAALGRMLKGRLPTIDELAGVKPAIRIQTPDEVRRMFAAMREAAASATA